MKQELQKHLIPLALFFVITSIIWIITKSPWYNFAYLFFGLLLGSFLLDIDHLIYWYYLEPDLQESKVAKIAIVKKDYNSVLKLLEFTHKDHSSLIFHHYLFQIILALISFFVFTSSDNPFGKALLLAINYHLLADEIEDLKTNPKHLQNWLFARSPKQLPLDYLKKYVYVFIIITIFFAFLLIKSNS